MIIASFTALATTVKEWHHEVKRQYVAQFIQEQSKQYKEFRGLAQDLLQLIPTEPITGNPVPNYTDDVSNKVVKIIQS